ncbi:YgjD/Kae1/Qri7 family protein [Liberibacter crescens BT-1]|uniref:tRNA N6-adenosine threonylcarbamoyltransferase n=1 Tax=Liberibacter crescens (strain BT-1) TaxID=1215343 RepID=L0EWI9_LIBCB|nr:tRNA (adenosine(37)-N6)-threonylcarbamoyltransferase complex transferase subunit TsaD [Liberibacter crescens]AGA64746.1 YgjD/Kae1/Qri7 family protein [Liberibacter crescens BT-1]AMC12828.1 protein kinase [Liberibacter crescens]
MVKRNIVLGIESSCDETATAIIACPVDGQAEILADIILSQSEKHSAYGGVVPEIAARAHVEVLDGLIAQALSHAGVKIADMDAIAVTAGPGLVGGLIVGLMTAKSIAYAARKPLYAINHLEGHVLTARLLDRIHFPYLTLLVSGGHTQLILVKGVGDYERWGTTIDDALGECFDKIAKILELGFPGGPALEKAAQTGNPERFQFPRPLAGRSEPDFSFSGLKTAVRKTIQELMPLTEKDIADVCASFQETIACILTERIERAFIRFCTDFPEEKRVFVVAGGVAANSVVRSVLTELCDRCGFRFIAPPHRFCTDNAAMIAWAALERMAAGFDSDSFSVAARSRWPLDSCAVAKLGSGKRGAKA